MTQTILQRMEVHVKEEHQFLAGPVTALVVVENEAMLELCRTCEGLMKEYKFLTE